MKPLLVAGHALEAPTIRRWYIVYVLGISEHGHCGLRAYVFRVTVLFPCKHPNSDTTIRCRQSSCYPNTTVLTRVLKIDSVDTPA